MERIQVIDSHTEGEPTRVVVGGFPDLGPGSAAERVKVFAERFDGLRSAIVEEPRGSEAWVGALLLAPESPESVAQVIYFNNSGYLGMCVHGTIGLAATLRHMGKVGPGKHRLETPVGDVWMNIQQDGRVAVDNVPSYRLHQDVMVQTSKGPVVGDVAWGGNWFFVSERHGQEVAPSNLEELSRFTREIKAVLARQGITGIDGAEIDHVELFAPPARDDADSKNYVLCPGLAYDRSPCGTGTSAKLACLAAAGKLAEGAVWRQESIIGSMFEGAYRNIAGDPRGAILPTVTGRAFVTAETEQILDPDDPFRFGLASR